MPGLDGDGDGDSNTGVVIIAAYTIPKAKGKSV